MYRMSQRHALLCGKTLHMGIDSATDLPKNDPPHLSARSGRRAFICKSHSVRCMTWMFVSRRSRLLLRPAHTLQRARKHSLHGLISIKASCIVLRKQMPFLQETASIYYGTIINIQNTQEISKINRHSNGNGTSNSNQIIKNKQAQICVNKKSCLLHQLQAGPAMPSP